MHLKEDVTCILWAGRIQQVPGSSVDDPNFLVSDGIFPPTDTPTAITSVVLFPIESASVGTTPLQFAVVTKTTRISAQTCGKLHERIRGTFRPVAGFLMGAEGLSIVWGIVPLHYMVTGEAFACEDPILAVQENSGDSGLATGRS